MGNSDIGQLTNQAVLQISRKYTHMHIHINTSKEKPTSIFHFTVYFFRHSDNHLWLVGGRSTGLLWRKCIYTVCLKVCMRVQRSCICVYTKPPRETKEGKKPEKVAGILGPNGKSQYSCCLPAWLFLPDSLHALSTRLHPHMHKYCE